MSVNICPECRGRGKYVIKNAYDPKAEDEVICEYCDGDGSFMEFEDAEDDTSDKNRDWN